MTFRVSSSTVATLLAMALPAAAIRAEERVAQPAQDPSNSGAAPAHAAPPDRPTEDELQALRQQIQDLKDQVQALRDQLGAIIPPVQPAPGAARQPPAYVPPQPGAAAPSQTSNYFNPSVSVIGNFLGVGGSNGTENLPSSSLRESEVSFQAIVDPYARADFFLSFGEEGVGVEEGFVTFTSLPAGVLAKVGRMRTAFGKI